MFLWIVYKMAPTQRISKKNNKRGDEMKRGGFLGLFEEKKEEEKKDVPPNAEGVQGDTSALNKDMNTVAPVVSPTTGEVPTGEVPTGASTSAEGAPAPAGAPTSTEGAPAPAGAVPKGGKRQSKRNRRNSKRRNSKKNNRNNRRSTKR